MASYRSWKAIESLFVSLTEKKETLEFNWYHYLFSWTLNLKPSDNQGEVGIFSKDWSVHLVSRLVLIWYVGSKAHLFKWLHWVYMDICVYASIYVYIYIYIIYYITYPTLLIIAGSPEKQIQQDVCIFILKKETQLA